MNNDITTLNQAMKIHQYLNKLNKNQKITFGLTISLSIIIFLVHNPFSGYIINQENIWNGYAAAEMIPSYGYQPQPKDWESITLLPFNLWKTNFPLFDWLGNVVHFIYSLVTVISTGAIFIGFVFSNSSNESD